MRSSDRLLALALLLGGCSYDKGPLGLWAITEYTVSRLETVPDANGFPVPGGPVPGTTATAADAGTWECNLEGIDSISDEATPYGYNYVTPPRSYPHTAVVLDVSYEPYTAAMLPIRAPSAQIGAGCESTELLEPEDGLTRILQGPFLFERFTCPFLIFEPGETLIVAKVDGCALTSAPPGAPELAGSFYGIELVLETP